MFNIEFNWEENFVEDRCFNQLFNIIGNYRQYINLRNEKLIYGMEMIYVGYRYEFNG